MPYKVIEEKSGRDHYSMREYLNLRMSLDVREEFRVRDPARHPITGTLRQRLIEKATHQGIKLEA